jgi:hypothetical protein
MPAIASAAKAAPSGDDRVTADGECAPMLVLRSFEQVSRHLGLIVKNKTRTVLQFPGTGVLAPGLGYISK